VIGLWLGLGCGGGTLTTGTTGVDTGAASTGTACWWCVDTGLDSQDTSDPTDSNSKTGKDDTGKGGDEVLSGRQAQGSGLGSLSFADYDASAYCGLNLEVVEATAADTCDDCDFAWLVTLSDTAEVTKDGGGCGPGLAYEGTSNWWGHGADGQLWSSTDGGAWSAESGSTSKVMGMSWTWSLNL